jgi:hypothetical protein
MRTISALILILLVVQPATAAAPPDNAVRDVAKAALAGPGTGNDPGPTGGRTCFGPPFRSSWRPVCGTAVATGVVPVVRGKCDGKIGGLT